jgi:tRNA(Ile)-lysidine synthase
MRKGQTVRDALSIVRAAILREGLILPDSRVLVACSGGPDSTALLHILFELSREVPLDLAVAHFNHRLRAAAGEDERCVRDAARALGLPLVVGRRDVRAYASSRKLNLEEAARGLRYAFLGRTAARMKADVIATGHTLNDQAETLLMRLLRGSGPRGLSGIFPSLDGRVVRPLLGVTRSEIEGYCRRRRLAFREDESNRDRRLLRNRIRLGLIPYLERHLEPLAVRAIGRSARIIQDEDSALEAATRRSYSRLARGRGRSAELDAAGLARLPSGLGRRVVRAFFEELRGDLRRFTFDDVEAVRTLEDGAIRVLPGRLRVRREGGRVRIDRVRRMKLPPKRAYAYSWDGRAPLVLRGAGWVFRGRRATGKPRPADFDDRTRAYCDAASLRFPLEVSVRKPGDRYRPLGAPGAKKLKEILRAKGISPDDRAVLPIIRSDEEIVWAPGLPVAERFKVTAKTKAIFVIEAARTVRPPRSGF